MHTTKIVMMEKNLLPLKFLLTLKSQLFFKTKMKSSKHFRKIWIRNAAKLYCIYEVFNSIYLLWKFFFETKINVSGLVDIKFKKYNQSVEKSTDDCGQSVAFFIYLR